ncbi:nucleoside monophosphate kinase [Patescibacteria group bacterium]|nr:nucleoside monophosphate kinase [Patescibacteria group bacterium]
MVKQQPINIILLGDPAAGKATQAQNLMKKFRLYDLDMGRELRRIDVKTKNPSLRRELAATLNKGKLTPTKLVREIFKQVIGSVPKNKGILFDGTPKMIGEARLVKKILDANGRRNVKVIYLSIPQAETLKRMVGRREYFKGKYSKRADDTPAALKNRIRYYHKNIAGVKKYFAEIYGLHSISGMGGRHEVFKRILKQLA